MCLCVSSVSGNQLSHIVLFQSHSWSKTSSGILCDKYSSILSILRKCLPGELIQPSIHSQQLHYGLFFPTLCYFSVSVHVGQGAELWWNPHRRRGPKGMHSPLHVLVDYQQAAWSQTPPPSDTEVLMELSDMFLGFGWNCQMVSLVLMKPSAGFFNLFWETVNVPKNA